MVLLLMGIIGFYWVIQTVTHNTVLALNLAAQVGLKTIVIVHKEFLMNQWIERIEQFLPDARVGKFKVQLFKKKVVILY